MSEQKKSHDAEDILSEFQQHNSEQEPVVESTPEPETVVESAPETIETPIEEEKSFSEPEPAKTTQSSDISESHSSERNVIFVGTKPIMTYVTATLTQLASQPTVTIKARGKRITQAVDVSQMIVKRMDTVGYQITDVRISSDSLTSQDGRQRNVSTMEIDITKN